MCTLSYLPLPGGWALASSRDEMPQRGARSLQPRQYILPGGQLVVYPGDEEGGGTWLLTSQQHTLVLLNGGLEKHQPAGPYRHSRGLVPLHFLEYDSIDHFAQAYCFEGLEPFSLVALQHQGPQLGKVVWTGDEALVQHLDASQPRLFSSSTLYDAPARLLRRQWYAQALAENAHLQPLELLMHFHLHGGAHWPHAHQRIFSYRKGGPCTVSITTLLHTAQQRSMHHHNLLLQQASTLSLAL